MLVYTAEMGYEQDMGEEKRGVMCAQYSAKNIIEAPVELSFKVAYTWGVEQYNTCSPYRNFNTNTNRC